MNKRGEATRVVRYAYQHTKRKRSLKDKFEKSKRASRSAAKQNSEFLL